MIERPNRSEEEPTEVKDRLKQDFLDYYQDLDYCFSKPIPLTPGEIDRSVTFTGATINGWKRYLDGEKLPRRGVFTVQPCLRNRNLNSIYDIENAPSFCSYFNMAGILAPIERSNDINGEINHFLINKIGLDPNEIQVHIPSKHPDLKSREDEFRELGVNVATDEISWYDWQYGMEGISGRGITYAVKNPSSSRFEEIGNSVLISNNDSDIAVECGFGLETFSSKICGVSHPIYASEILKYFSANMAKTIAGLRLCDATEALSAIYSSGINLNESSVENKRLIEKYIRGICYLGSLTGIGADELLSIIDSYSQDQFGAILDQDSTAASETRDYYRKFEERRHSFESSVEKIIYNPIVKTKKRSDTLKSLRLTAKNNGIHNNDQATGMALASPFYADIDESRKEIVREAFSKPM